MNDKQVVTQAVDALLVNRDPHAVDRYFGPGFTEHGPLAGDGTEDLREWVSSLPPAYQYERFRVLAQDGLVAVHGRYQGLGDAPLIAFDLYRVSAGRVHSTGRVLSCSAVNTSGSMDCWARARMTAPSAAYTSNLARRAASSGPSPVCLKRAASASPVASNASFTRIVNEGGSVEDIVNAMLKLHGDRDNPRTLWHSARTAVAKRG